MLSLSEHDITPGQDRVENHERRPFRDLGDFIRPHNRFDIKGPEATREQDEVRRLGGKQRGLVSTWGCVDDDEVSPTLLRRPEKRSGSVCLNSSLREDKWCPAGFRLLRIAAAG